MCEFLCPVPASTTLGTVVAAIGARDALPIAVGTGTTPDTVILSLVGPDMLTLIGIAFELRKIGGSK